MSLGQDGPEDSRPELYNGDQLETAVEKSRRAHRSATSSGAKWSQLRWKLKGGSQYVTRAARRIARPENWEVTVAGVGASAAQRGVMRYVGPKRNLAFLAQSCFDQFEVLEEKSVTRTEARSAVGRHDGEDILFVEADTPLLDPTGGSLEIPAWIRQRACIEDWPSYINILARKTRNELRRFLRKYAYSARVVASDDSFESFYWNLYRPHTQAKYGAQAVIKTEREFRKELAGAQLVELLHEDSAVAANVIRHVGDAFWILSGGASDQIAAKRLKGATDALDYFCFLQAPIL